MTLEVEVKIVEASAATTVDIVDHVSPPMENLTPAEIPAAATVGKNEVKKRNKRRSKGRRQVVKAAVPLTSEGGGGDEGEPAAPTTTGKKEKKRTRPFPPRRQSKFLMERQRNARKLWFVRSGIPRLTLEQLDEVRIVF
jgi:hypothetical protein